MESGNVRPSSLDSFELDSSQTSWKLTSTIGQNLANFGYTCQIPVLGRFRQSDTKIWGSLKVESGYQQTPMLGSDEFPQTCMQE
jgi:hypothetical protein